MPKRSPFFTRGSSLKACPVAFCKGRARNARFFCARCERAIAPALLEILERERRQCWLAGIAHSQELFAIRDEILRALNSNPPTIRPRGPHSATA